MSLENWRGEPCTGCGDIVDDDSRYHCERCAMRLPEPSQINVDRVPNGSRNARMRSLPS